MKTKTERWTIYRASREFGLHRETLAKRLRAANIQPGKDAKYSRADIKRVTEIDRERERKLREECDALAIANQKRRRELIEPQDFLMAYRPIYDGMVGLIKASSMKDYEKQSILEYIAQIWEPDFLTRPL